MDKAKLSDNARVILKNLRAGKRYSFHIIVNYSRRSQLFFTSDKLLRPCLFKARWIAQLIHPFINSFLHCSWRRGWWQWRRRGRVSANAYIQTILLTYCLSYTADEMKAFEVVMKLERGFREVVDAYANDTGAFVLLIKQVMYIGHICVQFMFIFS